jgi:plastocyanin
MSRLAIVLPLAAFAAGGGTGQPIQGRTHTIEIQGMEFHPPVLRVARGDTVVWINRDIVPHTATSTGKNNKWDTGQLAPGATGRYVPRRAGTARYSCTLHPTMKGLLIIGRE